MPQDNWFLLEEKGLNRNWKKNPKLDFVVDWKMPEWNLDTVTKNYLMSNNSGADFTYLESKSSPGGV